MSNFRKTYDPTNPTHPFGLNFTVELPADDLPGAPASEEFNEMTRRAVQDMINAACARVGVDPADVQIEIGEPGEAS